MLLSRASQSAELFLLRCLHRQLLTVAKVRSFGTFYRSSRILFNVSEPRVNLLDSQKFVNVHAADVTFLIQFFRDLLHFDLITGRGSRRSPLGTTQSPSGQKRSWRTRSLEGTLLVFTNILGFLAGPGGEGEEQGAPLTKCFCNILLRTHDCKR